MKTTDWFGPRQQPVHQGWYQLLVWLDDGTFDDALDAVEMLFWDGEAWVWPGTGPGEDTGLTPDMAWRGLTQPIH